MTIISETTIEPGQEPQWDQAYQQRLEDARGQPGFITAQLLIPIEALNRRVVVGTWQTRAHWEAWHNTPAFQSTRQAMDLVQQSEVYQHWYEVIGHATSTE